MRIKIKKVPSEYEEGGFIPGVEMRQEDLSEFKKGGIHIKKSHEGKFTAYKKRTGKTTEEALHSKDPHVRAMANFARNAAKWKHQEGGAVIPPNTAGPSLKGLIPTPRYSFAAGMKPTESDTVLYQAAYDNMRKEEPTALYNRAMYNKYGIPTQGSDGTSESFKQSIYNMDRSRQNAYEDAMDPNVMSIQEVQNELHRPLYKPKDILKKKDFGGFTKDYTGLGTYLYDQPLEMQLQGTNPIVGGPMDVLAQDETGKQAFIPKGKKIPIMMKGNVKEIPIKKQGGTAIQMNANTSVPPYNPHTNFYKTSTSNINETSDVPITSSVKPVDREDANIEAEKDEILMKPDLMGIYKIKGNTHKQGGTPLSVESGSFIFSNDKDLSLSKQEKEVFDFKNSSNAAVKNTPAKVLEREINLKDYNKFVSILQDKKASDISKTTAQLMLEKMQAKIGQVAFIQETKKGEPVPGFSQDSAPIKQPEIEQQESEQKMFQSGGVYGNIMQPWDQWYPNQQSNKPVEAPNKAPVPFINPRGMKNGIWTGDAQSTTNPRTGQSSNNWNAMTGYSDIVDYANAVHYPGSVNFNDLAGSAKSIQEHVIKNYPELVDKFHGDPSKGGYGMPNAGVPNDKDLGVRWGDVARNINTRPLNPTTVAGVPNQNTDFNIAPPGSPTGSMVPNLNKNNPSVPTLPYDIKGKLTPAQIASLSQLGLQSLSAKKYMPMRSQIDLPTMDFQKTNAQPYLNNINNQSYAAYQLAGLQRPNTASAIGSNVLGKSLDQTSQVLGNIDNQDVQRRLSVDQMNLGQKTNQAVQNEQLNSRYYDQVMQTNENYDREKRYANNQFASTLNQYQSQDDALAAKLASVNKYGRRAVYDKQGNVVAYKPVPLYEYDSNKGSIRYNADVADLNLASGVANPANSFDQILGYIDKLKSKNIENRSIAYILGKMFGSKQPIMNQGANEFQGYP